MPDYTQAGGSTYNQFNGYNPTTQPTSAQNLGSTRAAPKATDAAYDDYRAYLGVGLSAEDAIARAWGNHPSPPPPPPPPPPAPAATTGGLMPKTYSLQSATVPAASSAPIPNLAFGSGSSGATPYTAAMPPAADPRTSPVKVMKGPDGQMYQTDGTKWVLFSSNLSPLPTGGVAANGQPNLSPGTWSPGSGVSVNVPAGNGNLTKITGQSTSEGTAGMMSSGQVDGGVRTTTAGAPATGQMSGGVTNQGAANPQPVPTTTGGTNNTGVGTGAGSSTTTQAGGLIPQPLPTVPTNNDPLHPLAEPALPPAPTLNNPYAGLLNPFLTPINGATYQARLAGQGVANAEQQYGLLNQRMRDDLAARGLSQGGTSGIEAGDARDLMLQTAQARTTALNDAATTAADKGAQWELAKAQGNLAYGTQAFDQYYKGQLLPGEVQGQHITNETNDANLQLIQQNWAGIKAKIAAGTQLTIAEANLQTQIASNPWLAAALGALPGLAKAGGALLSGT